MRIVWIASGLAFVLLALAVTLRPGQRSSQGIADGSRASVAGEPVGGESGAAAAPRALEAEDLAQIMAVRSELGSAADRLGNAEVASAAFEQELRQLAGVVNRPAVEPLAGEGHQAPAPTDSTAPWQAIVGQAAIEVDGLANEAEIAGDRSQAAELRLVALRIREVATIPSSARIAPETPNAGSGLIDNCQVGQAQ